VTAMSDREQHDSEQIGAAIRAAAEGVEAPPRLRARIAGDRLREPLRRRRARWVLVPALGAIAAVALAIGFLVTGGGGPPSLAEAASAALREPTQPPPARDPRNERLVRAEIGGVRFPNYTSFDERWKAAGTRRDELSGRPALTLVYRSGKRRVGYTVVDGAPLEVPAGARRINREGLRLAVLRRHGALVVTWQQRGHTCVLASRALGLQELIAFADWS
jgi:hypothetical protein